jgi:antitoxin component HigA of HigAB toxin-antitoxin module
MPLAVCRIQKIKSWALLKSNETHTARTRETPNANPDVENIQVIVSSDNLDLATLVKNKIGSQKIRSNAVLALEMLLSASPEYFRPNSIYSEGVYNQERLDNFVQAAVSWLQSSWGERVVQAQLHLDEITPHIHAYIVPLDERGKLNCRALFGAREKLHQLQDSFASAVAHLGIERGIKGSTAIHTKIKNYYAAVNQDSRILDLEQYLQQPQLHQTAESYRKQIIETLIQPLETINYQLQERDRLRKLNAQLKQTALKSEQLRQQLEKELQIQLSINEPKYDLLPQQVAYELGLNPKMLKSNHNNPLEEVMRVNQCNFDDAVVWLQDRFGETAMLTAVKYYAISIAQKIPKTKFIPPVPSEEHWHDVKNYLTGAYNIPQKLVQTLHHRGLIYASATDSAVFIARNLNGEVTGAYINSTNDTNNWTVYPQSKRSSGWFHLTIGGNHNEPTETAILVSSPIEALSLIAQQVPHKHRTLYLVIDSQHTQLPLDFLQTLSNIFTCTSKDRAAFIQKLIPHIVKIDSHLSKNKNQKVEYRE